MVNFVNKFESDFSSKIGGYYVGFDLDSHSSGKSLHRHVGLITFNVSFQNFQLIRKGSFIEDEDLCELKILGNWNGAGDYLAGSVLISDFFKTDIDSDIKNFYFSFDYKHIDLFIKNLVDLNNSPELEIFLTSKKFGL